MSSTKRLRAATAVAAVLVVATLLEPVSVGATVAAAPTIVKPTDGQVFSNNPVLQWTRVNNTDGAEVEQYKVQISTSPAFSSFLVNQTTYNTRFTPWDQLPTDQTLYWRVAGRDSKGDGPFTSSTFSISAMAGPNLTTPANGAVLNFPAESPLFLWQDIPGVKSYEVEIDDAVDFIGASKFVARAGGLTLTSTIPLDQPRYWRVRGSFSTNGGGIVTAWSETRDFTMTWPEQAVLTSPPDDVVTPIRDLEFEWDPMAGAKVYELEVNKNIDFTGTPDIDVTVYGNRYVPPETLDNGSYHWRVRPKSISNDLGLWSETSSFTRGWPSITTLIEPLNGAQVVAEPMQFEWTAIDLAGYYEVQVGSDPNFSPSTYKSCLTVQTKYIPTYTNYSGTNRDPGGCSITDYLDIGVIRYWRVRGLDPTQGVLGLWSEIRSFTRVGLPPADYASPPDGATVSVPTLEWIPVQGAERYRVQVFKSSGAEVLDTTTYATSYTHTSAFNPADSPFSWYVLAIHPDGTQSVIPHDSTWREFNLVAQAPTELVPDPTGPAYGAADGEMPLLTWDPVVGATKYEVRYTAAGGSIFTSLVTSTPYPAFTSKSVPLGAGSYDWYVRAYDGSTLISEGAISRFEVLTIGVANLTGPENCPPAVPCTVLTSSPTFTWDPVPKAGGYLVYIAYDSNFTNITRVRRVYTNQFIPREELPDNDAGQAYYWHVRPCKDITGAKECGPDPQGIAAPSRAFQKRSAPVILTEPTDGATVANLPRFSWEDYRTTNPSDLNAGSYRIQTSLVPTFASTLDNKVVDHTYFTPYSSTYPEGPIYWRVRAIDGSENELTWSETRILTKSSPPPVHILPVDGSTFSGVPTFRWEPQPFAGSYQWEMYLNGDLLFSPGNKLGSTITTEYVHLAPYAYVPPGTYSWRIRRKDGQGREGPWSAGAVFTVTGASPELTSPVDGSSLTNDDLYFSWFDLGIASSYRYERSSSPSFVTIAETRDTVMREWAPTSKVPSGTWYWRVKALDTSGNVLGTSPGWMFKKVDPGQLPQDVKATGGFGSLTVTWKAPPDLGSPKANGYQLILEPGHVVKNITGITTTSYVFNGLTNGYLYTVTVAPKYGNEIRSASDPVSGTPNGCKETPFSDVADGNIFCKDIAWLFGEGITYGTILSDGAVEYRPALSVSRQAMAGFLYRFFGEPIYTPPTTPSFSDVPKTHTFFKEIEWLVDQGVTGGFTDGTYRPTLAINRGSMAAFLYRAAGSPAFTAPAVSEFSDVPKSHTFYKEIHWLAETEITTGYTDGTYRPSAAVTRATMAAFLHRFDQYLNP